MLKKGKKNKFCPHPDYREVTEYGNLKVGDIVRGYHSGLQKIVYMEVKDAPGNGLTERSHCLVHYVSVLNADLDKTSARLQVCDSSYCVKITPDYVRKEKERQKIRIENLEEVLREAYKT